LGVATTAKLLDTTTIRQMILRFSSRRRQGEVSAADRLGRCAWRIRTAEDFGRWRSRLLGLENFDR
jgi:hypothetical protein